MGNVANVPSQEPLIWRRALTPISVTLLLVLWTLAVSPTSSYGDDWAVWPAMLALPIALLWHMTAIVNAPGQRRFVSLVAIGHLAVLVPVWFLCLMLISKDSL